MDDLEITRLCARAIGQQVRLRDGDGFQYFEILISGCIYHPLHNRGQALELVERLRLDIMVRHDAKWSVHWIPRDLKLRIYECDSNLLRAVCLCAARMQQARENQK